MRESSLDAVDRDFHQVLCGGDCREISSLSLFPMPRETLCCADCSIVMKPGAFTALPASLGMKEFKVYCIHDIVGNRL